MKRTETQLLSREGTKDIVRIMTRQGFHIYKWYSSFNLVNRLHLLILCHST